MFLLIAKAAIVPVIILAYRPRGIRSCRMAVAAGGGVNGRQVRLKTVVAYTPFAAITAFRFDKFRTAILASQISVCYTGIAGINVMKTLTAIRAKMLFII